VRFVKGHGTENDFVVLPDTPEAEFDAALARALCDRRAGIGADGVLRVHRDHSDGTWFMDYRNADGSVAETCGNGIRVEMGPATPLPDATVTVGDREWKAHGWSLGNPHLVALDAGPIDTLDLATPPGVDPAAAYPEGVNVEVVESVGPHHIRMRVHERGSGETRSCGTGACAAAVAAMSHAGTRTSYVVDVPGGRLGVQWTDDDVVLLRGPAVLVAAGDVDPASIGSREALA
jgi:diaminopimelate epimerase